jgi:shikimate dehydrogenase
MAEARRAAVLGKPVAHSLSPLIHNAGYAAAGLTGWSYTAIECAEAELPGLVAGLGREWVGLSLTMPLKEIALAVAGDVTPVAAAIGAANTLVRRSDGSWYAANTDVTGMVDVLRAAGVPEGVSVTVLGAGGTARAALAAAARLRAAVVTVVARRPAAIDELRRGAAGLGVDLHGAPWADAPAHSGAADVVISTLPAGTGDALAEHLHWQRGSIYFDVVYDPWPTRLAVAAQHAGCRVIGGRELLLAQAVGQFELFTGVRAPVAEMRAALA